MLARRRGNSSAPCGWRSSQVPMTAGDQARSTQISDPRESVMRASLDELMDVADFTRRHTSVGEDDRRRMLEVIGEPSLDALLDHTVPPSIRMQDPLTLEGPQSPAQVLGDLRRMAARNVSRTSLIGMGYYGTVTPPVIQRNVIENPAWYTAYTPYQPEI